MMIFIAALSVVAHHDAILSLIPNDLASLTNPEEDPPIPNFPKNRPQQ